MATDIKTKKIGEDVVDLIALMKIFWRGKRILIKSVVVFGIIGLIIAIYSPKVYVAKTVMVPQVSEGQPKLGGLSSLAAMAGLNLNSVSTGSELSPTLYPQIITSIPFQLELMKTPLNFTCSSTPITLYDYYLKENRTSFVGYILKYTIGLPGIIINSLKGISLSESSKEFSPNKLIKLTEDQKLVRKYLLKVVSLEVNPKEGYLALSTCLPEPGPAAQLGQRAQELLQQYIIDFRIKKAKANLDFVQQRFEEAAKEYLIAQSKLAVYQDRNKNVSSAIVNTEQIRLQTQFNLISGVYTELAKQLEQAKIQVKQDTPVFTIIEPVSVPTERSKPKRSLILFIWLFFGGLFGVGIIMEERVLIGIKKRWKEA